MATFRSYPRRLLPMEGEGYVQCQRSGFLFHPQDMMDDFRGGRVAKKYADITPGFGTQHPQDVYAAELGGDPTSVEGATGINEPLSKQDLAISDAEILASIREDRAPIPGR